MKITFDTEKVDEVIQVLDYLLSNKEGPRIGVYCFTEDKSDKEIYGKYLLYQKLEQGPYGSIRLSFFPGEFLRWNFSPKANND